MGVLAMFSSILILFVLPWLDTSRVKSGKYRPMFKVFFWLFVITGLGLGYLGSQPAEGIYVTLSRVATFYYFAYFLIILPILGKVERTKEVPESISKAK